jgi:hypothetical protein
MGAALEMSVDHGAIERTSTWRLSRGWRCGLSLVFSGEGSLPFHLFERHHFSVLKCGEEVMLL